VGAETHEIHDVLALLHGIAWASVVALPSRCGATPLKGVVRVSWISAVVVIATRRVAGRVAADTMGSRSGS